LATPTAMMVASGRAASRGILIKNAQALETAAHIDTVVLDKTGTITRGKFEIVEVVAADGVDREDLLELAAAAQRLSGHPLATAVVEYYEHEKRRSIGNYINVTDLATIPGAGVAAQSNRGEILIGNRRLLQERDIQLPSQLDAALARIEASRATPLVIAVAGRAWGVLAAEDAIADGAAEAVAQLQKSVGHVVMLTGDHQAAADAVAHEVGIREVIAGVRPDEKHAKVERLQAEGRRVAMVGDGINDAPALTAADLGIAIGSGADVAIESADVVLVKRELRGVVQSLGLSRATLRTIKQNLAWAFVYNIVLIPLATGMFLPLWNVALPPIGAAAAMALSSVSVVANSLLLRVRRIEPK
jgi:Cu+-exporting ATPase